MRPAVRQIGRREVNGRPVIDVAVAKDEVARQYTDDGLLLAVHEDRLPDQGRIAQISPLPKSVTDQHHGRTRPVFIFGKYAAQNRADSEDGEKVRCNAPAEYLFRHAVLSEVGRAAARCRHAGKNVVLVLPVDVVSHGWSVLRKAGEARILPDHYQPAGVFVRQRAKQNRVHS